MNGACKPIDPESIAAADEFSKRLHRRLNVRRDSDFDIECIFTNSMYAPCVARDGALALANDRLSTRGTCVTCWRCPIWLLQQEKSKGGKE